MTLRYAAARRTIVVDDPAPVDPAGLLRWYAAMGVDIAVDEMPHDRFAESVALKATPPTAPATPKIDAGVPQRQIGATAETVALGAVEQAEAARDLADLRARFAAFDGCALKTTAGQFVFGAGEAGARVMFVGDMPGDEEDRTGVPFGGDPGALLDRMLAAIGLTRADVYLTQIVPWRPPGNRSPNALETAACLPFMHRHIDLVGPTIIVGLGQMAAQALLGGKESLMRLRGRWLAYPGRRGEIRMRATLHPRLLLETPIQKRLAWQDLQDLARALE